MSKDIWHDIIEENARGTLMVESLYSFHSYNTMVTMLLSACNRDEIRWVRDYGARDGAYGSRPTCRPDGRTHLYVLDDFQSEDISRNYHKVMEMYV